jgi:hypothetical protein
MENLRYGQRGIGEDNEMGHEGGTKGEETLRGDRRGCVRVRCVGVVTCSAAVVVVFTTHDVLIF